MSTPANEVAVLEEKLAEARKRAKPKTLAERLLEARVRRDSNEHLANRAKMIVEKEERELAAYVAAPAPFARKKVNPNDSLADARTQLAKVQTERDAANRELVALEEEIAANPVHKKASAALDKLVDEFISAAESGEALTDEKTRKTLAEIATRERSLHDRLRGELFQAGLPDVRGRIAKEFWNFIPADELRRSIDNFLSARAAALARLKQIL